MGRQKIYTMTLFVMFLPLCSLIWCSDASEQISPSHPGWNGWVNQSRGRSDQHQMDSANDRPEGNNRAEGNRVLLPRGVDAGTAG